MQSPIERGQAPDTDRAGALMKLVSADLVDVELGQDRHKSLSGRSKTSDVEWGLEHHLCAETLGLVARFGAGAHDDDDRHRAVDRPERLEESHRARVVARRVDDDQLRWFA